MKDDWGYNLGHRDHPNVTPEHYVRRIQILGNWYRYWDLIGLPLSDGQESPYVTHVYFCATGNAVNFTLEDLEHSQKMHKLIINNLVRIMSTRMLFQFRDVLYQGWLVKVDFQTATMTFERSKVVGRDQDAWFQWQVKEAAEKAKRSLD